MKAAAAQPTLGYPTKHAAAKALRARGLKPQEIAGRLGVSASAVYQLLIYDKAKKRSPAGSQRWRETGRTSLWLGKRLTHALTPAAQARGLSVAQLARRLLQAAAEENLVDAVLDDGPTRGEEGRSPDREEKRA
jgi:hypothetical protein